MPLSQTQGLLAERVANTERDIGQASAHVYNPDDLLSVTGPVILDADSVLGTLSGGASFANPNIVMWQDLLIATVMKDDDANFLNAHVMYTASSDGGATWSPLATLPLPAPDSIAGQTPLWINWYPAVIDGKLWGVAQATYGGETAAARHETYIFRADSYSDFRNGIVTRVSKISIGSGHGEVPSGSIQVIGGGVWVFGHYSANASDIWSGCCMRSTDSGVTWTKVVIATNLYEPVLFSHAAGLVAIVRPTADGQIGRSISTDGGLTWSFVVLLNVPATYSSNGAWGVIVGDTLVFVGRKGGGTARTECLVQIRNCISSTGSAASHDLPTALKSFGGCMIKFGDGRIGVARCSHVNGISSSFSYNEIVVRNGKSLMASDMIALDAFGRPCASVRGLGQFPDARLILDAGCIQKGMERARGKAIVKSGGSYGASVASHGYVEAFEATAITDDVQVGSAGDWNFLHNGLEHIYIAIAGYMPAGSSDVDLITTNGSSAGNPGIRLYGSANQYRLHITNGVTSFQHNVTALQRGAWFKLLWHISPGRTALYYGEIGSSPTSELAISGFTPSASNTPAGLSVCNYSTSGNTCAVGLKLTKALIIAGVDNRDTAGAIFACLS